MTLSTSRYNYVFKNGDDVCLFNARTCGFLNVPNTSIEKLKWLVTDKQTPFPKNKATDSKLIGSLLNGGFVLKNDIDELEQIKFNCKISKSNSRVSIVIVPTLRCNMRCDYCFEEKKDALIISPAIQQNIIDHIKGRLENGVKHIYIEWFGGEPLVCFDIIKSMSSSIQKLCKKHKATYSSSIVTNGTLLTKERAKILSRFNINNVQITLDGPPAIHDIRRPFVNGKGTFNIILKNIQDTCKHVPITIRCNVDKSNISHAEDLCKILAAKGLHQHVNLYFYPTHTGFHICSDSKNDCHGIYSQKSFASLEIKLQKMLSTYGFRIKQSFKPSFYSCGAANPYNFIVDPKGDLYKCGESLGMEKEIVGTIFNGFHFNNTLFKWINFDALEFSKCRACKILPICMGWCPLHSMSKSKQDSCHRLKYNLVNQLKMLVEAKNKEVSNESEQQRGSKRDRSIRQSGCSAKGKRESVAQ